MKARKRIIKLYWVTTEDHGEDWFILATTRPSAASYHVLYEGYNIHDASARVIVANAHLASYVDGPPPCHAHIEDLEALGFEIVDGSSHQRVVRYKGETFVEGVIESLVREAHDNQLEAIGEGRPNLTKRSSTARNN
ncbi:MAG TPA: hypothetical protein VFC39_06020 [Acidobacteriaceae bacterium]|nr:hypothetical protein [Acidobacteriaceae bacterium]